MFRLLEMLGFFKVFERLKHVKLTLKLQLKLLHLVVETLAYLALPCQCCSGYAYVSMRNCFSEM